MWDLIVSVSNHCLSFLFFIDFLWFYFELVISYAGSILHENLRVIKDIYAYGGKTP